MITIKSQWRILAAASVAAASLIGCNDNTTTVPTPPAPAGVPFSTFATQVFANNANSTPVPVSGLNLVFDVNDDPTAFNALIASGTYQ